MVQDLETLQWKTNRKSVLFVHCRPISWWYYNHWLFIY